MSSQSNPTAPGPSPSEQKRFRITTFSSLRYRDFRFLWATSFFNAAGVWIQQITLGWLVYNITESAFLTSAVQGIRALPFLLVGPVAGVIADRMDRKRLLIINEFFLSSLAFGFAILVAAGLVRDHVELIFAFSFLSGVGWALNQPVRQALVPAVVPREALMNAFSLNTAAFNLTRILGPAIGGVLIALFGPAANFFVQSLAYFTVLLLVLPMRIPPHHTPVNAPRRSMVGDMLDGLRYVAKERTILALIMVALIPAIFMMPFTQGLMPVFSEEVLDAGPTGLGILLASSGVGALVGTLSLATLGNFPRKGALLILAAALTGLSMMGFSQTTWLPLSMFALAIMGGFQMIYLATNNTIIHLITSDEYRGRVISIYLLDRGLVPAGAFLAGVLAEVFGAPTAILAAGAATTILVLLLATQFRQLREYR